ncbi:MAG: histidine phosphotransferase family protein [Stellaceae bacterium]
MQVEFRVLELLASRLCHELISPVGAINNGVELLSDGDAGFMRDATALIGQSARRAAMRLQFYRFAYGAGGVGGGAPDAKALVAGILEGGKVRCDWPGAFDALDSSWQKLACNLVLLAAETLPRGGTVTLARQGKGLSAVAAGEAVNLTAELKAALTPAAEVAALTARTVHAYFTARYAESVGANLTLAEADKRATFAAN